MDDLYSLRKHFMDVISFRAGFLSLSLPDKGTISLHVKWADLCMWALHKHLLGSTWHRPVAPTLYGRVPSHQAMERCQPVAH